MAARPIHLPASPPHDVNWGSYTDVEMRRYAISAVEADRGDIAVSDDDIVSAVNLYVEGVMQNQAISTTLRGILISFANRLRAVK